MTEFMLNGEKEPFLIVQMDKGDKVFAESDSLLAMQDGIEISGQMRGGFLSSVMRAVTSEEDFFQQTLTATKDAVAMLSPALPGDIKILDLSKQSYFLNDYAFFAADDAINLAIRRNQTLGSSLFGGDGFFVLHATGQGKLVINGLGSIEEVEIDPSSDFIVDNGHLLAWEEGISYGMEMVNSGGNSFFSRAMNSMTSGEGLVMRLQGEGKVYIASRNLNSFKGFVESLRPNS
jgi:uncharacterized protein (TIGR00266 family)